MIALLMIFDAEFYWNHPLYADCDESLRLQFVIYYNEVEVTIPMGSQKGKHKLGK